MMMPRNVVVVAAAGLFFVLGDALQAGRWNQAGPLASGATAAGQQAVGTREDLGPAELLAAGNEAYVRGALEEARRFYAACVETGSFPVACDAATNLGSVSADLGDPTAAEVSYRDALAAAARGAWHEGGVRPAAAFFHVDAAQNLASLLQAQATERPALREVAELYKLVVRHDESRWDAWANLGSALLDAGAPKLDAVKCLQRAIVAAEEVEQQQEAEGGSDAAKNPNTKNINKMRSGVQGSLAQMYAGLGSALAQMTPEEELAAFRDGDVLLTGAPEDADMVRKHPQDAAAVSIRETAANAFRTAVDLAGGSFSTAEHQLAALVQDDAAAPKRASATFVRALFDDFAANFDDQLVGGLKYAVPDLVAARLGLTQRAYAAVLDAGCGTGLVGPKLRDLGLISGTLVGADLSENMCDAARRRTAADGTPVYDEVVVGDLLAKELYGGPAASFDLVAAADVLCYFGDLEELLSLWFHAIAPGGDCIFSCEAAQGVPRWKLTTSGRYAHSPQYVANVVENLGFQLVDAQPIVARFEAEKPVQSTLYLVRRPAP